MEQLAQALQKESFPLLVPIFQFSSAIFIELFSLQRLLKRLSKKWYAVILKKLLLSVNVITVGSDSKLYSSANVALMTFRHVQ